MKRFFESLAKHTMNIINLKKKKMKLLTKEQQKSYQKTKTCYICKEKMKDKNYPKVNYHCHYTGKYRGAAHSIHNLKYSATKKLHNGSNYNYHFIIKELPLHNGPNYNSHFIIKELAEEFEKQLLV